MVEIPETYLLFFIGAVFIPLFGFLIKMIMEQSANKAKMDVFSKHIEETKDHPTNLAAVRADITYIKERINSMNQDIKHLFRRQDRNRDMEDEDNGGVA